MQTERHGLRNRIEKKAAYLQELEEQVKDLSPSCFGLKLVLPRSIFCLVVYTDEQVH